MAITGRAFGVRCSELIGVESPTAALDFDLTCALRLMQYENDREQARFEMFKAATKISIGEMLGLIKPEEPEAELSEDDIL